MSAAIRIHQRTLNLVRRIGAPVTFTRTEQVKNVATGALTPTVTTISGQAGPATTDQSQLYQALGLIGQRAMTLLFVPDTLAAAGRPELGDEVSWAGEVWRTRHVAPFEMPDAILCEVTVAR